MEYDYTLVYSGVLFMMFAGTKFTFSRVWYKMLDEEKTEVETPRMELEIMEISTAMVRKVNHFYTLLKNFNLVLTNICTFLVIRKTLEGKLFFKGRNLSRWMKFIERFYNLLLHR